MQGESHACRAFARDVFERAPPLARPRARDSISRGASIATSRLPDRAERSRSTMRASSCRPDYFMCETACRARGSARSSTSVSLHQLHAVRPALHADRSLPYDRPNTTMAHSISAPIASASIEIPLDRRFHAEPSPARVAARTSSCASATAAAHRGEAALDAALALLREGAVLAVKGIGGYHLMCDASNERAVSALRERKRRPDKPLAVMFPRRGADGLAAVREEADAVRIGSGAARSPARPIVLLPATGLEPRARYRARPARNRRVPAIQPAASAAARRL